MTQSPATRGAARGSEAKITRELVLATALELIDRDGADALSMRRLGAALGRDPMILYRHAPDKAALLDGVVEAVLAQLKVDAADPDWTAQLRAVARDYRALALAHPNVVPLLVTRPLATPLALRPRGTLRPLEDVLELLTRAGFSGPDALHIYRALFGFLNGHVLNELQELVENPDETDDLLRLGLYRLPIGEFPLLRSLAHALASYDGAAELERGLDILLTGLAATLTPQAASSLWNGPWCLVHRQRQRRPDDGRQVRPVDRLALKQQADDAVESLAIPAQQRGGRVLGLPEQPGHFLVDGTLRLLGVRAAGERIVPARPLRAVADRPDLGREPPLPHHVGRELGRASEVIGRAG
jgi:AcrR family transcriptional regulator